MEHVITRVPGAKICMTNQGIKRIALTNADDSGGHWVTTDDGNRLFITEGGEAKTGPNGKTIETKGGESDGGKGGNLPSTYVKDPRNNYPSTLTGSEREIFVADNSDAARTAALEYIKTLPQDRIKKLGMDLTINKKAIRRLTEDKQFSIAVLRDIASVDNNKDLADINHDDMQKTWSRIRAGGK